MIGPGLTQFILALSILLLISFFLERLWLKIFSGRKYQFLIFLGVFVHEISHALGCLITGAKIHEIGLFSARGSYVKHSQPKIKIIGNFIISFAPIIGGIVFIWLSAQVMNFSFPLFVLETPSLMAIIQGLFLFITNNWRNWTFWFFIYIVISVVISLPPSKQDLKNSYLSVLAILLIMFLIEHFEILALTALFSQTINIIITSAFLGIIAILFSLPVYFIKKLF